MGPWARRSLRDLCLFQFDLENDEWLQPSLWVKGEGQRAPRERGVEPLTADPFPQCPAQSWTQAGGPDRGCGGQTARGAHSGSESMRPHQEPGEGGSGPSEGQQRPSSPPGACSPPPGRPARSPRVCRRPIPRRSSPLLGPRNRTRSPSACWFPTSRRSGSGTQVTSQPCPLT